MKKFFMILAAILLVIPAMSARDKVYHSAEALPAKARTILKENFPKADVNRVKVDSHLTGGTDYEVVLSNGVEIEFDKEGNWTEVDCGRSAVPSKFVMKPISDYVSKNYKGQKIVQIERTRKGYELELSNGMDLEFNHAGIFQREDP